MLDVAGARYGLRLCVLGLAAALAAVAVTADPAEARQRRTKRAPAYQPPYASIVIDANSGAVLQAASPDSQRHPASLTKVMTLYLLFEQLEAGKLKLQTPMRVSAHAAAQAPTKLGLKPGSTIAVEDAIKAVITKSANDAAVVIAEALAGEEDDFAEMMTRKARSLGMTRTVYRNASGLPDGNQITSARDQALLGRAIQERFPHHYRYFATRAFVHRGAAMRNHNKLLGQVEGVDGIKTGFTRASGFNLLTSVRRGNRHIVAVVLGGRSGGARDASMRALIAAHVGSASTQRTVAAIVEKPEQRTARPAPRQAAAAAVAPERADPASTATVTVAATPPPGSNDPIQPTRVRTITFKSAGTQTATLGHLPALAPAEPGIAAAPLDIAAPPQAAAAPSVPAAPPVALPFPQPARAAAAPVREEPAQTAMAFTAQPNRSSLLVTPVPPRPAAVATPAPVKQAAATPTPKPDAVANPAPKSQPAAAAARRPVRGGWIIQVGAFPDEGEAKARLQSARAKGGKLLGGADPFTEQVVKGDQTLYRARFAGFDKDKAESACKLLKRNDIACIAVKN